MLLPMTRRREEAQPPHNPHEDWTVRRADSDRFVCQLDALLRRLGDVHLRISVARLAPDDGHRNDALMVEAIADNLLDPCAMSGVMPDGSVVAAFLGPRSDSGTVGDEETARRIRRQFQRAVGVAANYGAPGPQRLVIIHGWTDQIRDLPALTHEFQAARQQAKAMNHIQAA